MYRGYCNTKQLILPDPTINLQRVVDNGYKLQGVPPNSGQTVGYNGSNVVWVDSVSSVPNLQEVLDEGHTATDVPIQLNGPNTADAFTVMEHDIFKIDNQSGYTNEMTALKNELKQGTNTNNLTATTQTIQNTTGDTNISTAIQNELKQGTNTNNLTATTHTIQNSTGGTNISTAIRQTIQNNAGDTNISEAGQNRLQQDLKTNISNATTILISDSGNTNTITATSNTIYKPTALNTCTAENQTFSISGFYNEIKADKQTFANSTATITNELTASTQTLKNGVNDTNVSNATSITIKDNSSNHNSTYKYNEVKINGTSTFTATPTDITIVNGIKSIAISNGDTTPPRIQINNMFVCPEFSYYVKGDTIIDDYSAQSPCKITYCHNGKTFPYALSPNTSLFPSSISVTAMYDFNGTLVIGTETGECYRWNGSSFEQFAKFDTGPITSFTTTKDTYLLIGGKFTSLISHPLINCSNIALCDSGLTVVQISGSDGFNAKVNCLKQCDTYPNLIFVGGEFSQFNPSSSAPFFGILDFSPSPTTPAFKPLGNFSGGSTGGFDGFVNTISNTGNTVFIGGSFTQARGSDGIQYDYKNGTIWQCNSDGTNANTPPFTEINGSTGISNNVVCSDYDTTNLTFCIGLLSNSTSSNVSLSGVLTTGTSLQNPVRTIYTYSGIVYFGDGVNVYSGETVIGPSSTIGVQGISYVPHLSQVGFGINTSGNIGFNYLTPSTAIVCQLPTGTFFYQGSSNSATAIQLNNAGSWFYLLWDGTKYQILNNQYYDITLI
jgi:hypothetical protein